MRLRATVRESMLTDAVLALMLRLCACIRWASVRVALHRLDVAAYCAEL